MRTLQELITEVYAVLRDERREFVTEPMVTAWLNEAQRDLASRIPDLVTDEKTGTVGEDATTYYASDGITDHAADKILVPSDLTMVKTLRIAEATCRFVDDEVFDSYLESVDTVPVAIICRIFGVQVYTVAHALQGYERFIEPYSDQTSNDYIMRYIRRPVELVDPNDVCEVPDFLETKMVNYARSHAKGQQGEDSQRDYYMALYTENLPSPPRGTSVTRPGPLTLAYEGGPFDYEYDASHRG